MTLSSFSKLLSMKNTSTLLYLFIIFLFSLFIFKTVIYSLFIVFFFLLGSILIEIAWEYRQSSLIWTIVSPFFNLILSSFLALSVYCLIFLPIEFSLTELYFIIPMVPKLIGTICITFLIVLFALIGWQKLLRTKLSLFILLIFLVTSSFAYKVYHNEKKSREYLPKIYSISPNWGIQGVLVDIEGLNFGPAWRKGKVKYDGEEMTIVSWNDDEIIAEVQVPSKFGQTFLFVQKYSNISSNQVGFELRDPNNLHP